MKTSFALFAVLCAWAFGAESPAPNWQPELNVRLRVESRDQNFTFNSAVSSPTDGTWLLTRVRVGVKGKFSDALSLYAQA
jgi:hypothetical protein